MKGISLQSLRRGRMRSAPALKTAVILFILGVTGCSKDQADKIAPDPPANEVTSENVSYNNFAGALFQAKCNSCHASGGSASAHWTFSGYASVRDNAERINNMVLVTRAMPMGGSLTTAEQELLTAWFGRDIPEN